MKVDLNTTLSLPGGLIHLPISLSTARSTDDVKFARRGPKGQPVKRIDYEEGDKDREPLGAGDFKRGVEVGDAFYSIDPAVLTAIEEKHKLEGLTIKEFMPASELDLTRVTGAYFLYPQRAFPVAAKGLRLLYEGLKAEKAVAPVILVMRSRQQRAVIVPDPSGALMVLTMVWEQNAREPDDSVLAPQQATVAPAEKKAVRELVKTFMGDGTGHREAFDTLNAERQEIVDKVVAGEVPEQIEVHEIEASPVEDLMAALTASMESSKKEKVA